MNAQIQVVIERDERAFERWCEVRLIPPTAPGVRFAHATDLGSNAARLSRLDLRGTYPVIVEYPSPEVAAQLRSYGVPFPVMEKTA